VQRLVSNPPNPWASAHVHWLGEPPPVELTVYEERAATALAKHDSPDVPFRYSVNPYRGCQHACAYCYARPTHQYLGFGAGTDFDSRIVVKRNIAECLDRELQRRPLGGEWIAFSGVTDCYQPLEASYGLTRACLEVCLSRRTPVGVVTKSALVRRDAELLARLEREVGARVFLSIPFADRDQARAIEPWAAEPAARFETLRRLSEAGVPTGVALAPLIPGLNESQVPEILERARDAGARKAFMVLLRLPAETRPVFEERLRAALPLRAEKVLSAQRDMRGGRLSNATFGRRMQGEGARWEAVRALFEVTCRRLGLETRETESVSPAEPLAPRNAGPVQRMLFDGSTVSNS
jgi:DNA repair photolyase